MKWELLFTHLIAKNTESREAEEVAEGYLAATNGTGLEVLALGPVTLLPPTSTTPKNNNNHHGCHHQPPQVMEPRALTMPSKGSTSELHPHFIDHA